MHIVHPSFFFNLQLTESAEISEQKDEEKTKKHIRILAFSSFSSLEVLISLR